MDCLYRQAVRQLRQALPSIRSKSVRSASFSTSCPKQVGDPRLRRRRTPNPTPAHLRTHGRVVAAGKMDKTVTVQYTKQHWNRHLHKNYNFPYNILVHDENNSIREGDIITVHPFRFSKTVYHAVKDIIVPFGSDEGPPLATIGELQQRMEWERHEKKERRKERQEAANKDGEPNRPLVDAGGKGKGKGLGGKGREVLPGGLHKFGAINDEAIAGKRRTQHREFKAYERRVELEQVHDRDQEQMQKEALNI